jgi:hypothetical protein
VFVEDPLLSRCWQNRKDVLFWGEAGVFRRVEFSLFTASLRCGKNQPNLPEYPVVESSLIVPMLLAIVMLFLIFREL